MKEAYLFGASGHGKVIKDILDASGVTVEAFIDDNPDIKECYGLPVLHDATKLSPIIVSIGVNNTHKNVVERLIAKNENVKFGTAIHPTATVSPSAIIGEGTVIMAGAIINADAVIGKHCIINTGASVDHECVIGDYCHIAPHATLCGQVHVGEGTLVGVSSSVIPCINIGSWSIIGAGSAVIGNVPDNTTVVGNPAKPLRSISGGGENQIVRDNLHIGGCLYAA